MGGGCLLRIPYVCDNIQVCAMRSGAFIDQGFSVIIKDAPFLQPT